MKKCLSAYLAILALLSPAALAEDLVIPKGMAVSFRFKAVPKNLTTTQRLPIEVSEDVSVQMKLGASNTFQPLPIFKKGTMGAAEIVTFKPRMMGRPGGLVIKSVEFPDVSNHLHMLDVDYKDKGKTNMVSNMGANLSTVSIYTLPLLPLFWAMKGGQATVSTDQVFQAYTTEDLLISTQDPPPVTAPPVNTATAQPTLFLNTLAMQLPPYTVRSNKEQEDEQFFGRLHGKIRENWVEAIQKAPVPPIITLQFDQNGNVFDTHIIQSSGVPEIDNLALDAVRKSMPMYPVPPGFFNRPLFISTQVLYPPVKKPDAEIAEQKWAENFVHQVRKSWKSSDATKNEEHIAYAVVGRNGKVLYRYTKPSQVKSLSDLTVIQAIDDAGPYAPFPPNASSDFLRIQVTCTQYKF